ncbi:MAG TPA: endonuclease/exonuclease/phosphatase family protein [Candidatus Lokiarchaeia archaeon]|nr:endonuclease/exonuclease/phosphatase family protein [Candidatus Lokiarchaeia archaeon]
MTFNIRYAAAKDGINCWANRKHMVVELLQKYAPDVIACQEVLPEQLDVLKGTLSSYKAVAVSREGSDKDSEMVPLFIRGFTIESSGVFWLSDTPDVPGSNTWGSLPRMCTWALLQDAAGRRFGVFNTHLDHRKNDSLRLKSVPLLLDRMQIILHDEPAILLGDFNCNPRSKPYLLLNTQLVDASSTVRPRLSTSLVTFHNYTGRTAWSIFHPLVQQIDYIWLRESKVDSFHVNDFRILHDHPEALKGVYPSDHWPVLADLELA